MSTSTHLVHPGLILLEEFMEPFGVTPYRLAKDIGVDKSRIYAITQERRDISTETAARLSRYFGTSEAFWVNLQARYDLSKVHADKQAALDAIRPLQAA